MQRGFIGILSPVIYAAKWLVTGKNPRTQERGMDFHYNVVDWVGGYPFEVAKPEEVLRFYDTRGLALVGLKTSGGGHGCNELVFRRALTTTSSEPSWPAAGPMPPRGECA